MFNAFHYSFKDLTEVKTTKNFFLVFEVWLQSTPFTQMLKFRANCGIIERNLIIRKGNNKNWGIPNNSECF